MLPLEHSAILLTSIKAIIGIENQFLVFLRVTVLHRFYCKQNKMEFKALDKSLDIFLI